MNITLIVTSFLAGMLTVVAPCVLPVLPIIIGGTAGTTDRRRPFVITASLVGSVLLFTLLLKASTLLIGIPQEFWTYLAGGIILTFGLFTLWPELWDRIAYRIGFSSGSQELLAKAGDRAEGGVSLLGAALLGAALGPVFGSCSPTYFVILATVLPVSFAAGVGYLLVYGAGLAVVLLAISYFGQNLTKRLRFAANPHGWFRRSLGALLILVGLAIVTGLEKEIELKLIDAGFGTTALEERLLDQSQGIPETAPREQVEALPRLYRAPDLYNLTNWLHSEPVETISELRGKVVLIDFWTYSCINCIRTLPYLQSWHEKYAADGLVVLGIHAPEFQFERIPANVARAVEKYGLTYPIAQDNDYATWRVYLNRYWPAKYLIDREGYVRFTHFGEGEYAETEAAIAELLGEEVKAGTVEAANVHFDQIGTPETYLGTTRRENLVTAASTLNLNEWTLQGRWTSTPERIVSDAPGATLRLRFKAAIANLVLSGNGQVRVLIDGEQPTVENAGADVVDGIVTLDGGRLYELVNFGDDYSTHEITLEFLDEGISGYAWTFG